jgi:hypothetical protein
MADDPTPPAPPADPSIDQKLTAMKTEILDAVKGMLSGHGNPPAAPSSAPAGQPQDLQAQIDAAVAKVTGDRDAKDAQAKHDAEHEQIRAAAAEKPPMERKSVHRLMGWGEPAK